MSGDISLIWSEIPKYDIITRDSTLENVPDATFYVPLSVLICYNNSQCYF